jgi:hypothetical protein
MKLSDKQLKRYANERLQRLARSTHVQLYTTAPTA